MLGMAWAYAELGWGGYWAWDPVENAACMPLLTGTAFIHSVMIQERRGMLKMWNAWLVALTFILTIFGTFLTRSGVVSSVHSFGASTLGTYFLVFLVICIAFSVWVITSRRSLLQSEHRLDSIWSREASFIINNIILVGAAFSILWGTTYPIISEALTDVKAAVGAPFFNRVNVPIAIVLILLTGIGPLIAWRKASLEQLRRSFLTPAIVGLITMAVLAALGVTKTYALLVFGLSMFVLAGIVEEFYRGIRARRNKHGENVVQAMGGLILKNPRRYGGYLVHIGVLLFFVGIAASSAYQLEREGLLVKGETMEIGPYHLRLENVEPVEIPQAKGIAVTMTAFEGDKVVATLRPEKLIYRTGIKEEEQPTTNVAIRSNWKDDLYILPSAYYPDQGKVHIRAYVNPMVSLDLGRRWRGPVGRGPRPRSREPSPGIPPARPVRRRLGLEARRGGPSAPWRRRPSDDRRARIRIRPRRSRRPTPGRPALGTGGARGADSGRHSGFRRRPPDSRARAACRGPGRRHRDHLLLRVRATDGGRLQVRRGRHAPGGYLGEAPGRSDL